MPLIKFSNRNKIFYKNFVFVRKIMQDTQDITNIKNIIGIFVNGKIVNLNTKIKKDSNIEFLYKENLLSLKLIRSACLQLFSYSVKFLWPDSKLYFGKLTDIGFNCDLELKFPLTDKKIFLIKKQMLFFLKKKYFIFEKKITFNCLLKKYTFEKEYYKILYLKKKFKNSKFVKVYYHENFFDLKLNDQALNVIFCKYFHIHNFSGIQKDSISKKNRYFQRIYFSSWESKEKLENYKKKINLYKNRDHRVLNKSLKLFYFDKNVPGMVFWNKNGCTIFNVLISFLRKKLDIYGYDEVKTPLFLNKELWKKSGHLKNYKNLMFFTESENKIYSIKPMNCPGHIQIFKNSIRSYKDLPLRIAEFGYCHRNEPSGSLHGLMRIRHFTQDDAHIFCRKTQLKSELIKCINMIYEIYNIFSFKRILLKLSTRPKLRIGKNKTWDYAELILIKILKKLNISFLLNKGDGAFYGPKIEFELEDCLGRKWQCGTIQLDFYLTNRLKAFYISKNNKKKNPVLIHRAIIGSIERFIGILVEEYKGKFPLWLSPIQIVILNVNENSIHYVKNLFLIFKKYNFRVILDLKNVNLNIKIKKYVILKVPYIIICGDKEVDNKTITVRNRCNKIINSINVLKFINDLLKETKYYKGYKG